jgi:hypothetical protein
VEVLPPYEIPLCENDTNNDDVTTVPIITLVLSFQNTIDKLKDVTTGAEIGFSQAVQQVCCAEQGFDKKTG